MVFQRIGPYHVDIEQIESGYFLWSVYRLEPGTGTYVTGGDAPTRALAEQLARQAIAHEEQPS